MEIGGIDEIMRAPAEECAADAILRVCHDYWPDCVFQDAEEEAVHSLRETWVWLRGTASKEFFVYETEKAERSWEEHGAIPENANTMLHVLIGGVNDTPLRDRQVTVVFDKPTGEMGSLVADLKRALDELFLVSRSPLQTTKFQEAA